MVDKRRGLEPDEPEKPGISDPKPPLGGLKPEGPDQGLPSRPSRPRPAPEPEVEPVAPANPRDPNTIGGGGIPGHTP